MDFLWGKSKLLLCKIDKNQFCFLFNETSVRLRIILIPLSCCNHLQKIKTKLQLQPPALVLNNFWWSYNYWEGVGPKYKMTFGQRHLVSRKIKAFYRCKSLIWTYVGVFNVKIKATLKNKFFNIEVTHCI